MPDAMHDQLVTQARAGSPEALDQLIDVLVSRFFNELGQRNLRGMSPATTISDLIQETVLRARERFSAFDKETFSDFKRWADGILRNKYREWARNHRDRSREAKQSAIWQALRSRRDGAGSGNHQTVDAIVAQQEEGARAYAIFERELKPHDRYIVALRIFEGLKFKQIAELVGSKEDTVTKAYRRALSRLKALVEQE